ncbi:MAG: DHH family phosphoesterase [Flavobacteriaceae bacterium]|nr:DHH family phosphoesterase [Flavobacteriaceae bacterium]
MKLKNFLKKAKEIVRSNNIQQIVVGNESADLDSIISANLLAFAYNALGEENIIPLINCKKRDYKLRTESYGLFKRYDIDENDLIFIDDIDKSQLTDSGDLKVIVVDHNKLPDNLRAWDNAVVSVFDHHQDVGMYASANPRYFETVGSCSTLIARFILKHIPDLYKDEDFAILNISPILVDTINLDPEQGRVTDEDIEIVKKLESFISVDLQKLYDDLQYMKSDVSALSSQELLRKDYKQWANKKMAYGMASVPLSIENWLQKDDDIAKACDIYMKENNLDMLLVMTAYMEDSFKRELIVIAPDKEFLDTFNTMLNETGLELTPYPKELKSDLNLAVFNQGGLGFSRKKIQPLIEAFLK